jgi:hypothetical protein
MMGGMDGLISHIFPVIYGACFLLLLWQAFQVMRKGFSAVPRPGDARPESQAGDRTGQPTIHPELLDADGRITREDLLTVRFSEENDDGADRATPAE